MDQSGCSAKAIETTVVGIPVLSQGCSSKPVALTAWSHRGRPRHVASGRDAVVVPDVQHLSWSEIVRVFPWLSFTHTIAHPLMSIDMCKHEGSGRASPHMPHGAGPATACSFI